ncbi:MAG: class I SAM-dependent methyltransferase [Bacteroidia bacterium]
MHKAISSCRICGNKNLIEVVNLGNQYLTGVFPKSPEEKISSGPLVLVKCDDISNDSACGLLQLAHSYDHNEMYGENYGYRSGLNKSMVRHLQAKVNKVMSVAHLNDNDLIIDIGSNDATTLRTYPAGKFQLVGIDPTGNKFKNYYPEHISLIADFFSDEAFHSRFPGKKAKVVSSIAMFYDLEEPMKFMQHIYNVLDNEGIWIFEQSYMPSMLKVNAYDTICHEHLEYYALKQIKWMADRVGFKIIDVELNNSNGGSFEVICAKKESSYSPNMVAISPIEEDEAKAGFNTLEPFIKFNERIIKHRTELINKLKELKAAGKKVLGYGASTKGNVILQYCGITNNDINCIAEVNEDKFGSFTPGTLIPMVSEADAKAMKPDYFLVLPWHFKENTIEREQDFIQQGGKFLFPLPDIHEVGK